MSRTLGGDPATWRWGNVHQARFEHPFWRRIPLIGRLAGASIEVDGGNDTINRAASRLADPDHPFAAVHGAGFRGVYDLGDLGNSRFVLSTGQSGNPLSRHYRDMTSLWRDGAGIRLNATRDELEARRRAACCWFRRLSRGGRRRRGSAAAACASAPK